ncbi:hypothetical protein B0H14DRAFT_2605653 [Mycena olivaceomarginata]|nr:hypothetical protein B0H14DRAFT_2605653 [Mycena olivaceomarginata]
MREFHRSTRINSVLNQVSQIPVQRNSPLQFERDLAKIILGASELDAEAIGTVQDAARADTQGGSRVVPGSVAKSMQVEEEDIVCLGLFKYYNRKEPQVYFSRRPIVGAAMLSLVVEFHDFAILDGKRLTPTARSRRNTAGSSLIQFRYQGEAFAGEVRQLLRHVQPGVPTSANVILAYVSWMKRSNLTPLDGGRFPWDNHPQLGVETWEYDTYANPKDENFPPIVMPLDEIHCQISRGTISHTEPPLWITTTMDRFPTSLLAYGFGDQVQ